MISCLVSNLVLRFQALGREPSPPLALSPLAPLSCPLTSTRPFPLPPLALCGGVCGAGGRGAAAAAAGPPPGVDRIDRTSSCR